MVKQELWVTMVTNGSSFGYVLIAVPVFTGQPKENHKTHELQQQVPSQHSNDVYPSRSQPW